MIVYHFMWRAGAPFEGQCPGCTHTQVAMNDAVRAYLAERDVGYAVFSAGPWAEIAAYRDFMGWTAPWYSTAGSGAALATCDGGDLRCYLRVGEDVFQTYWTTQRGVEAMLVRAQAGGEVPEDLAPGPTAAVLAAALGPGLMDALLSRLGVDTVEFLRDPPLAAWLAPCEAGGLVDGVLDALWGGLAPRPGAGG